jgi:uncharacterized integral membrane protein
MGRLQHGLSGQLDLRARSVAETAVERPRRVVRFAQLIHQQHECGAGVSDAGKQPSWYLALLSDGVGSYPRAQRFMDDQRWSCGYVQARRNLPRPRHEEDAMTAQPGGQQPGGQLPDGRKLSGGAIASLTGVGVLLIFIIQNTDRIRFQFLFWTFTWPLWWYTIMTALFGALVWFGLGVMRRHRRRVERRAARY